MWARFKSQRIPKSSGNCWRYSVKWRIASREPVGTLWTAAGEMGRMHELSPAHDAVFGLAAPHRGQPLEEDDGIESELGQPVLLLDPGPRVLEELVSTLGIPLHIEDVDFTHQRQEPLRIALPGGRHGCVQLRHHSRADRLPVVPDLFERGIGRPAHMSRGLDGTAGVQVEPRHILELLSLGRRGNDRILSGCRRRSDHAAGDARRLGANGAGKTRKRDHGERRDQDQASHHLDGKTAKGSLVSGFHGLSQNGLVSGKTEMSFINKGTCPSRNEGQRCHSLKLRPEQQGKKLVEPSDRFGAISIEAT